MNQVFFVTGSSRGLGRQITEQALAAGHRVVATARNPRDLDDLARRYGDSIHVEQLDVTDPAAAQRAVENGAAAFGRLDVVVNNAGQGDRVSLEDTTIEVFRRQVETNFLGTVYVTKAAVPVLREQGGGRIIQVSSLGGRIGSPGMTAYQSAKWAVGGFSEALAAEVAPLGIKVTVLEPGGMRTDWAGASMTTPSPSAPYQDTSARRPAPWPGSSTSPTVIRKRSPGSSSPSPNSTTRRCGCSSAAMPTSTAARRGSTASRPTRNRRPSAGPPTTTMPQAPGSGSEAAVSPACTPDRRENDGMIFLPTEPRRSRASGCAGSGRVNRFARPMIDSARTASTWTPIRGAYWCVAYPDTASEAAIITVGVPFEHSRWFRGRETRNRTKSGCPDPFCCRRPSAELAGKWDGLDWPSARAHAPA
jgi:NAD(P)-dependent dehydrogenase (short-subunit alcohol dehydrogenase family)